MVDVALALMAASTRTATAVAGLSGQDVLLALLMLSWVAALFPRIMVEISGHAWTAAHRMLGI